MHAMIQRCGYLHPQRPRPRHRGARASAMKPCAPPKPALDHGALHGFRLRTAPIPGLQAYDDVIQAATGMASFASMVDGDNAPPLRALHHRRQGRRHVRGMQADPRPPTSTVCAPAKASTWKCRCSSASPSSSTRSISTAPRSIRPPARLAIPSQIDPARQPFPTKRWLYQHRSLRRCELGARPSH